LRQVSEQSSLTVDPSGATLSGGYWLAVEINSKFGKLLAAKLAEFASDSFAALCWPVAIGQKPKMNSSFLAIRKPALNRAPITMGDNRYPEMRIDEKIVTSIW
jgi:hypothetical protein